jgi:hypothetical protein
MIYVFKTSVKTKSAAKELRPHLDGLSKPNSWNFDLEDRDKILRITGPREILGKTIKLLQDHGYECEELEDEY